VRRRKLRASRCCAALGIGLALLVAACGGSGGTSSSAPAYKPGPNVSWAATVKAADAEGQVTLYNAFSGYNDRVQVGFEKAYPDIKLTIVREATGDLITKMEAEKASDSAGADVALIGSQGFFTQNESSIVPLYGPAASLYKGTPYVSDGNRAFRALALPYTFTYNTAVLKKIGAHPITTWQDLLQPKLKGLIGIVDPADVPTILQMFEVLGKALGNSYLQKLAALKPQVASTIGTSVQDVAAGNLAVYIGGNAVTSAQLEASGAPLVDTVVSNPAFTSSGTVGIVSWAKHPAAAQVLENWMLSRAGQEAQHSWGKSASLLPDIQGSLNVQGQTLYDGTLTPADTSFEAVFKKIFGFS
jgi:iron(III) transport system substrate-binding protein